MGWDGGIAMQLRLSAVKSLAKNFGLITAILVATAAGLRAGEVPTTSMQLTGVGDGVTLGDVYVDPYTATVGGVANTSIICDDWSNNTYYEETWMASVINATTVGNTGDGTPMFGNSQSLYNELAWLGAQMLANPTNPTEQTEISFAMWDLTYGVDGSYEDGTPPLTYLSEYQNSAAQCEGQSVSCYQETLNLIAEAGNEGNYNSAGWDILNPIAGSQNNQPEYGTPQEFMFYTPQPVPESSQAATLAGDLLLFAVAVLILRRRGFLMINR